MLLRALYAREHKIECSNYFGAIRGQVVRLGIVCVSHGGCSISAMRIAYAQMHCQAKAYNNLQPSLPVVAGTADALRLFGRRFAPPYAEKILPEIKRNGL